MRALTTGASTFLLLALMVSCSGEPLRVTAIQVGRSLNADSTVAGHTTAFAPTDTVYVSVLTSGTGSATIGVRWMFAGRVLGEPTKQVTFRDDAATEFHLQSVSGFPAGDYSVEVSLNGQPVGARSFRVEQH